MATNIKPLLQTLQALTQQAAQYSKQRVFDDTRKKALLAKTQGDMEAFDAHCAKIEQLTGIKFKYDKNKYMKKWGLTK